MLQRTDAAAYAAALPPGMASNASLVCDSSEWLSASAGQGFFVITIILVGSIAALVLNAHLRWFSNPLLSGWLVDDDVRTAIVEYRCAISSRPR